MGIPEPIPELGAGVGTAAGALVAEVRAAVSRNVSHWGGKKKTTNPKPEKIGEYFGSQRLSRGFFFPARSGPRHSGNALVGSGTSSALGRGFTGASAAQNYFSTPRMSRQSPEQPRSLLSREGAPGTPHWCGQIHLPEGTSQGRGGIWGCSGGVRVSGDVTVTLGDVTGTLGGCARDTRGCQGHSGMCQ